MKTKLLKKIRKRFVISKDDNNSHEIFGLTFDRYTLIDTKLKEYTMHYGLKSALDEIFSKYFKRSRIYLRRKKINDRINYNRVLQSLISKNK